MDAPAFGSVLTAMVTPLTPDRDVDLDAAAALAVHLVDSGNDGLVVNGTTGESPTTSDEEKAALVRAVVEAVGDRAVVVAGVGTNDTAHSIALARRAAAAGASGLLVVSPYYSRPSQAGLRAHVRAVADAEDLPVMLYDIPGRTAVEMTTDTLLELGEHPRVVAVKDAKGDLPAATRVMAGSDLQFYSGDDALTLAHLTNGGVGVVGVSSHVLAPLYAEMVAAVGRGDLPTALRLHREALPVVDAIMTRMPGVVSAKAALQLQGRIACAGVRLPLVDATAEETAVLRQALADAGLL